MKLPLDTLYCGDNLEVLRTFPDGCVDLCYIDPPFFSQRTHRDVARGTTEIRGFEDTWNGSMEHYLEFMRPRLEEIHRVLSPNGSFYLHCDVSGVFHLKVICDEIFGMNNFQTCIVWKRHSPSKNTDRNYGNILDYILYYVKGPDYTFNVQYLPINEEVFNMVEPETGRRFRSQPLVVKGNQEGKVFDFGGRKYTIKKNKALKWSQETINKRLAENPYLIYWTRGGEPRYKTYLDEHKGIKLTSLWTDIKLVTSTSSERLDFPTQKPVKLVDRVIRVSSNEGDVVLDAFMGSGTTPFCAKQAGRRFIGIDISPTACRLAASRVDIPIEQIRGYPMNAKALEGQPEFEIRNWICWMMDAVQEKSLLSSGVDAICKETNVPIHIRFPGEEEGTRLEKFLEYLEKQGMSRGVMIHFNGNKGTTATASPGKMDENSGGKLSGAAGRILEYSIEEIVDRRPIMDGIVKN